MKVSSNFRLLDPAEVAARAEQLKDAWKYHTIPKDQWTVARAELKRYQQGERIPVFDALVDAVRETRLLNPTVLDVGAGVGVYRDVLKAAQFACRYEAMDYSKVFAQLAQTLFPGMIYHVTNATGLPFIDNSFEVVMSGACIMHVLDYPKVISECARVASQYVILHRTPVLLGIEPTQWFEKEAYDVPVCECHLNRSELADIFNQCGLTIHSIRTIFVDEPMGYESKTYLLRKAS